MKITPNILKTIPQFADLDEIELIQVIDCFSMQRVAAGEVLYEEGPTGDYWIASNI
jgi:hypothetical protein